MTPGGTDCYDMAMMFLAILVLVFSLAAAKEKGASDWSYPGDQQWALQYPACGGHRQSPVNIENNKAHFVDMAPIIFNNYDLVPNSTSLSNDGFTVRVLPSFSQQLSVAGGGLSGEYVFDSLHFHWGSDGTQGSEHTLDSFRYPMEMHVIHYKRDYGNLTQALNFPDGLAVLSVLFRPSSFDNLALAPLLQFSSIQTAESETTTTRWFTVASLLPADTSQFYRYLGSLTTPTCTEAVVWTVFRHAVTVSPRQLFEFRTLKNRYGHPLQNNYRPVQQLHARKIEKSFR